MAKGRSKGDAPQIDGTVFVVSRRPLRVGEIATVKIDRADAYDLHGTAMDVDHGPMMARARRFLLASPHVRRFHAAQKAFDP